MPYEDKYSCEIDFETTSDMELIYKHLKYLMSKQTEVELSEAKTIEDNEVGCNYSDAKLFTHIVNNISNGYEAQNRVTVSDVQELRARLPKYWKQFI